VIGRNENIAWGSASTKADVQDIFREQFKTQFDSGYNTPSGWKDAQVSTEVIPVRFGKDVEHKIFVTRHGPVLLRANDAGVSLDWTGLNPAHPAYSSLYLLNRASGWGDFSRAAGMFADPPQTFVYADRWGNIGYKIAGDIPVRAGGGTGTMLNPGWLDKGTWTSILPADKLPQALVAPTTGLSGKGMPIIAANQRPASGGNLLPAADSSLYLGHQWSPPYRANRLLAALTTAKEPLTIGDMNELQGDEYSQLALLLAKTLHEAASQTHLIDYNGVSAINMLVKWKGQLKPDTPQGSIYASYMQTLARRVLEPTLGRDMTTEYMQRWPMWLTINERTLRDKPANLLPPEERTYNTFFLTTLTQSLKSLRITFDNDNAGDWQWGRIHQVLFRNVGSLKNQWFAQYFNVGPVAVGGAAECVNSCDVAIDPAALQYAAHVGPTQRMIIDMSDRDKFYQELSTGQSGHLSSPYSTDQLQAWIRLDPSPIAFSADQVMRQIKHYLKLENQYTR
jgi:penicillin G amidase